MEVLPLKLGRIDNFVGRAFEEIIVKFVDRVTHQEGLTLGEAIADSACVNFDVTTQAIKLDLATHMVSLRVKVGRDELYMDFENAWS